MRGTKLPAERDLAQRYGVSGPTVREAVRALSTLGLVDVRHGSGAYVTADAALLVATALSAVIRLGDLSCFDVLNVLGTLYRQAATEAVAVATEEDTSSSALPWNRSITRRPWSRRRTPFGHSTPRWSAAPITHC